MFSLPKQGFGSIVLAFVCLCLSSVVNYAHAQLYFFNSEVPLQLPVGAVKVYTDTSDVKSFDRYKEIRHRLVPFQQQRLGLNYRNRMLWVQVDASMLARTGWPEYLVIRNPQINHVLVWLLQGDSVMKAFAPTGDRVPFESRTLRASDFVFPLPANPAASYSILMLLEKRDEVVYIPVHFMSHSDFLGYSSRRNLLGGILIGLVFFLLIFSLFLYFNMREKVYVYYSTYTLLIMIYLLGDLGYLFRFILPQNPRLADFLRPLSIDLAIAVYILFTLELLEVKKYLPGHYRWSLRLLYGTAFLLVAAPFAFSGSETLKPYLAWGTFAVVNTLMLTNMATSVAAWRKKIAFAPYLVLVSALVVFSFIFYTLFLNSLITDNFLTRHLMRLTIATETSILAMVLSLRFKQYKSESEALLRKVSEQQEQIFKTTSDYQQKELQRLSSLLHDSVGSRLSALRLNLEAALRNDPGNNKTAMEGAITQIADLADEVRSFSHSFSPVLLQQKGLRKALDQYVSYIYATGQLNIQLDWMGKDRTSSYRYDLLVYSIVQELIQNILRHAKASEAMIQVICEDNLVSLYAEDNGVGFDVNTRKTGLGYTQIQQLVSLVNGKLQVQAAPQQGTQVSIEFVPLNHQHDFAEPAEPENPFS